MAEYAYAVPDGPKMLRETLCVAQSYIGSGQLDIDRKQAHIDRLQRLIDQCDQKRPIGPDGKHNDRHTPECGCDGTHTCDPGRCCKTCARHVNPHRGCMLR